jgi:polyisoprenoid-binding protein YceI
MNTSSRHALTQFPGYPSGRWKLDPAHSGIVFSVRNLLISTVSGRLHAKDVTLVTGEHPLDATVNATIDLTRFETGNETRDEHLRSRAFLDVAQHPTAIYRSSGVRPDDRGWIVDGDLTLHGITRNVPLVVATAEFDDDPSGEQRARFSAAARLDRREFGINRFTGGGLLSSNSVSVRVDIQLIRQ